MQFSSKWEDSMSLCLSLKRALLVTGLSATTMLGASFAAVAASPGEEALKSRSIAYVMTDNQWAVYQTPDGKEECPQGFSKWGPRERFKAMFPQDGGQKYSLNETQIALEGSIWNPTAGPDNFDYVVASGTVSYGMNLDGKIGANDFTSPDGEKGVDNQLFRVIGCDDNMRGPNGTIYGVGGNYIHNVTFNRMLIILSNVDDLTNDPEVDVTITGGLDRVVADAGGDRYVPGGTQRVDTRWAKKFTQHLKGKIVNGVLTTTPVAVLKMRDTRNRTPEEDLFRDGRLQLKLTPDRAEGIAAGYVDINRFYFNFNKEFNTFVQAYGRTDAHGMYKKMVALADAYPDPKTGQNTAISGAMLMKFTQTFVEYPASPKRVAAKESASAQGQE
jgi:hypothetical protein